MTGFRVSLQAQDDIRNIGRYTQRIWGAEQRKFYLSGLDQKFHQLAENPNLAAERREFDPPVRIHLHQRHLIVYVAEEPNILIVRVLHESMDTPSHI